MKYLNPGKISFKATIVKEGIGLFVEFPHDLKETFGKGNLVPIIAMIDGALYRGSLAKMGGERAILLIRKDIQAQIGKQAGDTVDITLELDDKPRKVELPNDLKDALKKAGIFEIFDAMAFTHQREYVTWVTSAKKEETRANRISKMIEMIKDKSPKK